MVAKGRNRFLYLSIACFAGLVAIFVADGYMGIYDTIYVTEMEYEWRIEPDYWERYAYYPENAYCCIEASWEDEMVIRMPLKNLEEQANNSGISKQALILVGDFLSPEKVSRSRLYNGDFKRESR